MDLMATIKIVPVALIPGALGNPSNVIDTTPVEAELVVCDSCKRAGWPRFLVESSDRPAPQILGETCMEAEKKRVAAGRGWKDRLS